MAYRVWREKYKIQNRMPAICHTSYAILPLLSAIRYTPYTVLLYETNIPAEKEKAGQNARISCSLREYKRTGASETPPQKGAGAALGMKGFKPLLSAPLGSERGHSFASLAILDR